MKNPIVSIIMPVYGVEDYVGRAVDSVRKQTFTDWELLAVDDGSPDRSGEILDRYAEKDPRIQVIHKENGGAPSARNCAIDRAKGKYFYFMDADDWAEPRMLADLTALAERTQAQEVISGYYIDTYYSDTEKYTQVQSVTSIVYPTQRAFREDSYRLFDRNLLYTPWNKLFLADYIRDHHIYFPNTFWDDFPFNLLVLRNIERVAVTSTPYYHFIRQRGESETAKYRSDMYQKREEEDAWMRTLFADWNVWSPEAWEFLDRRYIERLIGCVENVTNPACSLSPSQQMREISAMIRSDRAQNAVRRAKPQSVYMRLMLLPFRWKNTLLTWLEGKVISKVKSGNTRLFAALKANR